MKKSIDKMFRSKYVLASSSPRRIELMDKLGFDFKVHISDVEELKDDHASPIKIVKVNALKKSRAIALNYKKEIIISADTVVSLGNRILHKPESLAEAKKHLKKLSGNTHSVYTGFNLINTSNGKELYDYVKTTVEFRKLKDDEIDYYVKNHKVLDKAGSYGIQDDFGCFFVKKITGDYYNIVGLPLARLYLNILKVL
ncbi:Maf family protein [soil metagenome]